jgi:hypothetical protein
MTVTAAKLVKFLKSRLIGAVALTATVAIGATACSSSSGVSTSSAGQPVPQLASSVKNARLSPYWGMTVSQWVNEANQDPTAQHTTVDTLLAQDGAALSTANYNALVSELQNTENTGDPDHTNVYTLVQALNNAGDLEPWPGTHSVGFPSEWIHDCSEWASCDPSQAPYWAPAPALAAAPAPSTTAAAPAPGTDATAPSDGDTIVTHTAGDQTAANLVTAIQDSKNAVAPGVTMTISKYAETSDGNFAAAFVQGKDATGQQLDGVTAYFTMGQSGWTMTVLGSAEITAASAQMTPAVFTNLTNDLSSSAQ